MTKRLIATLLAASLALTSLAATPARAADSGEIGRLLLGAGTLFIIGSALSNNNSGNNYVTRRQFDDDRNYRSHHRNRLPQQCERTIRGKHGYKTVYSAQCLRKFGYVD